VLGIAAVVLTVLVTIRRPPGISDVDEMVYRSTLRGMRAGTGYYDAFRAALVHKDGYPPTQIRSVRPPFLYLVLWVLPDGALRWAVAVPAAAAVTAANDLGRRLNPRGGPVATSLVGMWTIGAGPYLYLHAELWGVAVLLCALAMLQRDRHGAAAGLAAAACLSRELFLPAFVVGFVLFRHRTAWRIAGAAVTASYVLHVVLVQRVLANSGYEPPLHIGLGQLLAAWSPGDQPVGFAIGLCGLVFGLAGLRHALRRRHEPIDRIAGVQVAALFVATTAFGRTYWGLTFGPLLAVWTSAMLPEPTRSVSSPTG
jgi:hypothetical protein